MSSNSKYRLVPVGNETGETYYVAGAFIQRGRQLVGAAGAVDNPRAVELVERANRCVEAEQRAERAEAQRDEARSENRRLADIEERLRWADDQLAEIYAAIERAELAEEEAARLREALEAAATSLEAVADEYLTDLKLIQGYAKNRAEVARQALGEEDA